MRIKETWKRTVMALDYNDLLFVYLIVRSGDTEDLNNVIY